jgi:hypothetical protein
MSLVKSSLVLSSLVKSSPRQCPSPAKPDRAGSPRRTGVVLGALCAVALGALATLPGAARAGDLAVAPLPDGRLQLFVISHGQLFTAWKQTRNPNSSWTPLAVFDPVVGGKVKDVTVGRLPDGRLQLFVMGPEGLYTSWKQNPNPGAGWTEWTPFEAPPAPVPESGPRNSENDI